VSPERYYGAELARIHHEGFGLHAGLVAPFLIELLAPLEDSGGLVLEVGCGSGHLTAHLLAAGLRVLATDASEEMLAIARSHLGERAELAKLVLPDDEVPDCEAIVSTGHVLNYLPSREAILQALSGLVGALCPGGLLAVDLCDLEYGRARSDLVPALWENEDHYLVTEYERPREDLFVREMTIFKKDPSGAWHKSHERHENVLLETAELPDFLASLGMTAEVQAFFGTSPLPAGMVSLIGRKL
jgi:SAM-dependent methyltransferase